MLSTVRRFILVALFAAFASQASALFISPDPTNPTYFGGSASTGYHIQLLTKDDHASVTGRRGRSRL